jgi:tryptophan synthase alpha chain
MDQVARLGSGYLYYVSLKGVTGAATLDTQAVADRVAVIRRHTTMPIGVGFGISDAASAKAVAQHADAVVIGSALIKTMEASVARNGNPVADLRVFMTDIRSALDEDSKLGQAA